MIILIRTGTTLHNPSIISDKFLLRLHSAFCPHVTRHENMSHACCNMCGLSSTFSGSEGILLPCDNEQMDIFNFLQRKTHNNANENSSFSNYDRETHDSSNEVVLCKMCIKRIEVVSAMRSQVKFCLTKLSYVDLNNFRVKEYEFMHFEGQSSIKSLYWVVMVLWVLHELSRLI